MMRDSEFIAKKNPSNSVLRYKMWFLQLNVIQQGRDTGSQYTASADALSEASGDTSTTLVHVTFCRGSGDIVRRSENKYHLTFPCKAQESNSWPLRLENLLLLHCTMGLGTFPDSFSSVA